jgi:hypothetical protein
VRVYRQQLAKPTSLVWSVEHSTTSNPANLRTTARKQRARQTGGGYRRLRHTCLWSTPTMPAAKAKRTIRKVYADRPPAAVTRGNAAFTRLLPRKDKL